MSSDEGRMRWGDESSGEDQDEDNISTAESNSENETAKKDPKLRKRGDWKAPQKKRYGEGKGATSKTGPKPQRGHRLKKPQQQQYRQNQPPSSLKTSLASLEDKFHKPQRAKVVLQPRTLPLDSDSPLVSMGTAHSSCSSLSKGSSNAPDPPKQPKKQQQQHHHRLNKKHARFPNHNKKSRDPFSKPKSDKTTTEMKTKLSKPLPQSVKPTKKTQSTTKDDQVKTRKPSKPTQSNKDADGTAKFQPRKFHVSRQNYNDSNSQSSQNKKKNLSSSSQFQKQDDKHLSQKNKPTRPKKQYSKPTGGSGYRLVTKIEIGKPIVPQKDNKEE